MHAKKLSCLKSRAFLIQEVTKMVGNVEFSPLACCRTQRLHLPSHQSMHNRQKPAQELPGMPAAEMLRSGDDEMW